MRRSRRIWVAGGGVVGVVLATIAACQTPTSMTITVSTDVDCAELGDDHRAHVVAGDPEDVATLLDPSSTKACEATGQIGEVVLLPREDENAAVGVKVIFGVGRATSQCGSIVESAGDTEEEQRWGGCIIARRRLAFIEGEALVVDVPLHADCIGVPCSDTAFTTCVKGGRCVPGDIDPEGCIDGPCGEGDLPPTSGVAASSVSSGGGGGAGGEGGGGGGGSAPSPCEPERGGADCASGFCSEEGVCCPEPCDGPCRTCVSGRCEERARDDDSEGCSTDSCSGGCIDGECDLFPPGEVCLRTCDDQTEAVTRCDGLGNCNEGPSTLPCQLYVCGLDACLDSCIDDDDCAGEAECDVDECKLACDDDEDCGGAPSVCLAPRCNTALNECEFDPVNQGEVCAPAGCTPDRLFTIGESTCNRGACEPPPALPCTELACEDGACLDECSDDADCLVTGVCDRATGSCDTGGTSSSSAASSSSSVGSSSSSSSSSSSTSSSATSSSASTTVSVASSSAVSSSAATTVASSSASVMEATGGEVVDGPAVGAGAGGDGGFGSIGFD